MTPWLPSLRQVFLDTSAHYALADPLDENHDQALLISQRLISARSRLFTTNFVLAETHALLLTRRGRMAAWRILREIDRSRVTVERVRVSDEQRAWDIIEHYDDKDFSFTDATSFAVMDRHGIAVAFTFDHHFAQYGFTVLTSEKP